jgi:nuclear pore complex protein Nup155
VTYVGSQKRTKTDDATEGISSQYDIPSSTPWTPFQKTKLYEIPDRIFEQYNTAEVSTMMGLFADLHHAWIAIDNGLYIWDYTHPNPDLLGFEEQPHRITAVHLTKPRPDVFVKAITHLLVVATVSEIHLIGLASETSSTGIVSVSLYQTGLQIPIKGLNVHCVVGSARTGRIFFAARNSNDVYEITYQQEEKWFSSRCAKINHTQHPITGISALVPTRLSWIGSAPETERVETMVLDDSRDLLYVLSSKSSIRVFAMGGPDKLELLITKSWRSILDNVSFMVQRLDLFQQNALIVAIDTISAEESSRLYLMATTSTGVRIFLSASSGGYMQRAKPTNMMVHHLKFPPPPENAPQPLPTQASSSAVQLSRLATDVASPALKITRTANRFPPGYCFTFVTRQPGFDTLFLSAPESGQISRTTSANATRFIENGQWLDLGALAVDVGPITPLFSASPYPVGFGNELAVQFDRPASEFAVLTSTGVQTFRRRRIVDVLASALREVNTEDGTKAVSKKFLGLYGQTELCSAAVAVACGQGVDTTVDSRVVPITDANVLEQARQIFIEEGGKASIPGDRGGDAMDPESYVPSPRANGLGLYISRLMRSIWTSKIVKETPNPKGGLIVASTIPLAKLRGVQKDLTNLEDFLEANKSFIEGLSGPEALTNVKSKAEEAALKAEHKYVSALAKAIASFIEGIAFVNVLFDEPVDEIVLSLADATRQMVRELNYETLFVAKEGKALAKELVKAIVNRSIARGSNVDTVAEALRRRCGSFCSAEDVVIFKAQEQLKKASEAGAESSSGRSLLNESLKLFQKVAGNLSAEHLQAAIKAYIDMGFYAGAIRLALTVAQEVDRASKALSWIKDGSPESVRSSLASHHYRLSC